MLDLVPHFWRPIGGRFSKLEYRNDEDLYTHLALCIGLLVLLGIALTVVAIFGRSARSTWSPPTSSSLPQTLFMDPEIDDGDPE